MLYVVIFLLGFIFLVYRYFKKRNDVFKQLGVPGPEPSLVFGNLPQMKNTSTVVQLEKWAKQYGKTYGYMEGATPVLVTSDLDMLQDVFVKKFSNFYARKNFPMRTNKDMEQGKSILMSQGPRWKRLRTIANPTFSASKLKQLFPVLTDSVDVLMTRFEKLAEQKIAFNIHKYFQELTIDVIGRVAFGQETSSQGDEKNRFLELTRGVISQSDLSAASSYVIIGDCSRLSFLSINVFQRT